MKVAFLIPSLRAGGAEKVFATLMAQWNHDVDEVHLVVLAREGPHFETLPPAVHVHDLGGGRFLLALPRLVRLLRRLAPDALLVTQAHMNAVVGALRPLLGIRRVVGRETSMPRQADLAKGNSPLRQAFYRFGYRRLDAVVCLSGAMASEVADLYGIGAIKLPIIPNPVLFGPIDPTPWDPGYTWISAVGRLERVKGFDLLLEALALLPDTIRLVLIGDGKLRAELEQQARDLKVERRVVFTGFQREPNRIVAASHAFVLSSRYEGLPNAALEALGLGLPLVAFDGPWGAREIVHEGLTGVLARQGDSADLARAIGEVLQRSWDEAAIRQWARSRYEASVIVARYREVLK